jgi:hypothetical protein
MSSPPRHESNAPGSSPSRLERCRARSKNCRHLSGLTLGCPPWPLPGCVWLSMKSAPGPPVAPDQASLPTIDRAKRPIRRCELPVPTSEWAQTLIACRSRGYRIDAGDTAVSSQDRTPGWKERLITPPAKTWSSTWPTRGRPEAVRELRPHFPGPGGSARTSTPLSVMCGVGVTVRSTDRITSAPSQRSTEFPISEISPSRTMISGAAELLGDSINTAPHTAPMRSGERETPAR